MPVVMCALGKQYTATPVDYDATILALNPTAYWRLDETTGTTMADATSNYPGTHSADAGTYDFAGAITASPSCLLYGTLHSYTTSSAVFGTSAQASTVVAWVKGNVAGGVICSCIGSTDPRYFSLESSTGVLRLVLYNAGVSNQQTYDSTIAASTLNDGSWHHIAVTLDGSTIRFYHNGVAAGTGSYSYTTATYDRPFRIGIRNTVGSSIPSIGAYDAYIDEVAIWVGTALSATNISDIYASRLV